MDEEKQKEEKKKEEKYIEVAEIEKKDLDRRIRHPFHLSNPTPIVTERDDKPEENGDAESEPQDNTHDAYEKRAIWATFPLYIRNAVVFGSAVINMREEKVEAF